MKRFLIGTAASAVMLASLAVPAFAAKPNNQACLGKDVSDYAQNGIVFFGESTKLADVIKFVAAELHFVGEDIQAHLAGDVPDEAVPNSCNN